MSIPTAKKFLVSVVLAAFLVVGIFGLSHIVMNMTAGDDALGCLFMNTPTLCAMNPFEHIAMWQSTFAASFSKEIFSLLMLTLLIVLFIFTSQGLERSRKTPPLLVRVWHHIYRVFIAKDPLQEAFSNGILHPKIF